MSTSSARQSAVGSPSRKRRTETPRKTKTALRPSPSMRPTRSAMRCRRIIGSPSSPPVQPHECPHEAHITLRQARACAAPDAGIPTGSARLRLTMARILVVEPVAQAGDRPPRPSARHRGPALGSHADDAAAAARRGRWMGRARRALADPRRRRAAGGGRAATERGRRGERRDRPNRRRGGDAGRRDDRQRPDRQHDRRRGAHDGPDARARCATCRTPTHRSGAGEWERAPLHRHASCAARRSGSSASARSARRSRDARPASRCGSSPATRT